MNTPPPTLRDQIEQLHQLYGRLTGQSLSLGFDRERLWFEFLRAGFTAQDLTQVVGYLQQQIRHQRRSVGALKLSHLLQLDRLEEDLNISRVRLRPPAPASAQSPALGPPPARRLNSKKDASGPSSNCANCGPNSAKACSDSSRVVAGLLPNFASTPTPTSGSSPDTSPRLSR
jgi:hypothetical protein